MNLTSQIKKNSTIIIALSGGPDSVYLLHQLKKLEKKLKLTLIAAHLNHKTRLMSNRDERFCARLCKKQGIIFESTRVNLKDASEEKARTERYAFFEELTQKYEADYLATGHHLNDSIETVLLNLTRGCSLQGLTGIPAERKLGKAHIIRPLSNVRKSEILAYLTKHRIKYVTDSTNKSNKYSRNKIRNLVLPILKKINPGLEKTFSKNIENFQKVQNFIQKRAQDWLDSYKEFNIKEFKQLDEVLQNEALTIIHIRHTGTTQGLTSKQLENTREIILKNKNLKGKLGKVQFETSYGTCSFFTKKTSTKTPQMKLTPLTKLPAKLKKKNTLYIRGDIDPAKITIRTWEPGDRFQPLGLKRGSKKLQDFFTDRKVPKNKRHTTPILTYKKDIVAVGDLEISEKYKVDRKTTKILQIQVNRNK